MEERRAEISGTCYNPELQVRDDMTTWLAEVLDGSMRTAFEYGFDGQELYGRDGRPLGPIFHDAVEDAETTASQSANLVFELRRRLLELDEYEEMIQMAKDNTHGAINTMVVVSDFPPELMDATQDVGGYNISRKQTMLRVITKDDTGKIKVSSQSLDGSNRQALEAIYHYLEQPVEPGELLGQRVHKSLDREEQEFLIDWLTGVYDRSLGEQKGGVWYGGRIPAEKNNTYDFVIEQQDLLAAFEAEVFMSGAPTNGMRYALAATMRERFKAKDTTNKRQQEWIRSNYSLDSAYYEMEQAALRAQASGQAFSGCGLTISANGDTLTQQELSEAGYGNKTNSETKYSFDKKMHCVVCQPKAKKADPMKWCGPCGICRTCDTKLKK